MKQQNAELSNKGMLLLALLENDLIKEKEINDTFFDRFNNAWNMFEQMMYENNLMKNSEIEIVS